MKGDWSCYSFRSKCSCSYSFRTQSVKHMLVGWRGNKDWKEGLIWPKPDSLHSLGGNNTYHRSAAPVTSFSGAVERLFSTSLVSGEYLFASLWTRPKGNLAQEKETTNQTADESKELTQPETNASTQLTQNKSQARETRSEAYLI